MSTASRCTAIRRSPPPSRSGSRAHRRADSECGAAPTLAVGKATGACQRLAAVHRFASPSQLVFERLVERKPPLFEQRKPVVAKPCLRETGDPLGKRDRLG